MFRLIIVLLILSFITIFGVYATGSKDWKSFNGSTHPGPAEFEILQQDNNGILLKVTLNGMNVQEQEINGKRFHLLSVPQASWTNESGKPKIPIIRTLLIVPPCNNMKVYMEDGDHISLKEYKAIPVGKKVIKNPRSEKAYVDEEFTLDEDFYSKNVFYPNEIARIAFSGYLRDQKIVQLEIHPIKYNPQTKELMCYNLLYMRLSYDGVGSLSSISKGLGPLAMIGQNSIINAPYAPMFSVRETGSVLYPERLTDYHNADYVIIASEPFYSSEKYKRIEHHDR